MILIIDDDNALRKSLGLLLRRNGYEVDEASGPDEALMKVRQRVYDLMLMDMNYSRGVTGEEGIELLRKVKIFQPETPVILITAWGSIELAVEGMRHGAYDFITKPWNNTVLLQRIATAINLNRVNKGAECSGFNKAGIIGESREIKELLDTVERIAPTDAPVLVLGENGTGKEMVANAIHLNSRRNGSPFVMVNLGGISQSLFESEMFGHAKGAFTGAVGARKGRFELADKGTIFLDEIGDLDISCQVKLLRVLQQHTFEPLGDSRTRKVDIRVVSATNADLRKMVEQRTFREDLFYRINLITLHLPALRERREDIPLLVSHFIEQGARANGIKVPEVSAEGMEFLTRLPYPGNIRQLKNMVERAMLTGGARLEKNDFLNVTGNALEEKDVKPAGTIGDMEKVMIEKALEEAGGNYSRASRILGLTRQALYRRMEKYGLK
ncbi:MAG: sigma-54 dependent transcriptional regulator [Muribaculaceae bacterium]|nr:sigma-54 dependent transcriptional regulator [Muribaculaceae bacterium]MDE6753606.1 sigma-54 dependent transcriptional regulator [Muribaculaceae bacterium]